MTPDCCPKRLKPYRVPIALQDEVYRQIKELLELDLIEPSDSDWAHPVVCVAKKNGSVRLCIEFRLLNSFIIPDAYPMKIARDLLYEVGKANFISVLDLTKGYWQIPIKEEARYFTAFVTHSGHFQWKVLPFGMKNAGSTFQRSMDKALAPHREYCRSYIDDVAIYSQSPSTQRKCFSFIERGWSYTVNLAKCAFGHNQGKFLGHIVGSGQQSSDPEKAEFLRNLSIPSTKKGLRSFLGLASYYRDYIPNFSEIVLPLTDISKGKVSNILPWSIEEGGSFCKDQR
ncbi:Retrovirus-related Pol polyprotein from transposon opus [Araneus ventricosus]|uniref:Retrovirus-related Pol polyprotein from transposon opus n=1 Tax=Araneus ventricosus TaxID=182803 RepID=A0A4Y2C589_ARAVE|nr:Retrovirus-related Pol polyprotein from transposon opus [Araneus ventricosus]